MKLFVLISAANAARNPFLQYVNLPQVEKEIFSHGNKTENDYRRKRETGDSVGDNSAEFNEYGLNYDAYDETNEFNNNEYYSDATDVVLEPPSGHHVKLVQEKLEGTPAKGHHNYKKHHKHAEPSLKKQYKHVEAVFGPKNWNYEKGLYRSLETAIRRGSTPKDREEKFLKHATQKDRTFASTIDMGGAVLQKIVDLHSRNRRSNTYNSYLMDKIMQHAQGWKRAKKSEISVPEMIFQNLQLDQKVWIEKTKHFKKKGITQKIINASQEKASNGDLGISIAEMKKYYYENISAEQLQQEIDILSSPEYQALSPFRSIAIAPEDRRDIPLSDGRVPEFLGPSDLTISRRSKKRRRRLNKD